MLTEGELGKHTLPVADLPNESASAADPRAALIADLEQISAQQSDEQPAASVDEESATPDPAADAAGEPVPAPVEAKTEPEPLDQATQKRIEAVQKQEKRLRDAIAKERAEFEKQREEWKAELDAAKRFADLRNRAKYDPAAVLSELGIGDDDFEPIARDLYARSKAGREKPENAEAARRMQREREAMDKISQLESKLEQFQKQQQEQAQRAEWERAYSTWYGGVTKSAESTEAPLFQAQLKSNPRRAEQMVQTIAAELHQESGEWPDASDVIAAYEKRAAEQLAEYGIPLETVTKRKPVASNGNAPAKTLAPGGSTTKPAQTGRPSKEEILRELERIEREQARNADI